MIVDGHKIAAEILGKLKEQVDQMKEPPVLGVVLVGNDSRSQIYIKKKQAACQQVGIDFKLFSWPADTSQDDLVGRLEQLQSEENLTGLIVQLPLPKNLDSHAVTAKIDPRIDVDCLNKINIAKIEAGALYLLPPTPAAILEILRYYRVDLNNKKIVVVGKGQLVGQPLCLLLQKMGLPMTVCINSVSDNQPEIKAADVVITGVGKPKIVSSQMVKDGVVIIDAGVSLVNGKTIGDVDFDGIKDKASLITPPVGGVGPVTVAKLLENVVKVAHST